MSGFCGADTAALRDVAGLFESHSRRLDELRGTSAAAVLREAVQVGSEEEGR